AGVQSQRPRAALRAGGRAPRLHTQPGAGHDGGRLLHRRELPDGRRLRVDRPAHPVPVMAVARVPVPEAVEAAPPRALSRWLAAARQFCRARTLGAVGAAVIVVMFVVALLAPVLATY